VDAGAADLVSLEGLLYPPRQAEHQLIQFRARCKRRSPIPGKDFNVGGDHEHAFEIQTLVSRVESPEDRRVRIVSLTPKGKELIAPIFRKHAAEIRKVFADANPKELRVLETTLKKIGKRAESLGTGVNPRCLSQR
jgi:hypothetical protein